ncbi:RNA polymerase sigma factor [Pendulispora albinea]|uniref:RNA polymerase sigma factor n=1 Tax=Pendulispora albinea TaxID=2741071 RepID=A0ABZ2MC83_9BACT
MGPSSVKSRARSGSPPDGEPERSDAELVALARARDPRAATWLWDRHFPAVRALLYRTLGPGWDVDDLVQEVFVGFFRNIDGLRDPSAVRSFLFGIALRVARSALRKRRVRRWLRLTGDGHVPDVASAAHDPSSRAALLRLYAVLGELADRDRLAFALRHGEGYELTEVAGALGCSLATAKRCLARADEHVLRRAREEPLLQSYITTRTASEVAPAPRPEEDPHAEP